MRPICLQWSARTARVQDGLRSQWPYRRTLVPETYRFSPHTPASGSSDEVYALRVSSALSPPESGTANDDEVARTCAHFRPSSPHS